jgi:hypothetical protein
MKRAVLTSFFAAILLAEPALAQSPPTDQRIIPPRSIRLTAQQGYIIKENVKDLHVDPVRGKKEIKIGDKLSSDVALHEFPELVLQKVPKVKTYKFFINENQIVVVSPRNEVADIIK